MGRTKRQMDDSIIYNISVYYLKTRSDERREMGKKRDRLESFTLSHYRM